MLALSPKEKILGLEAGFYPLENLVLKFYVKKERIITLQEMLS